MLRKIFILVFIFNSINIRAESINYFETESSNPATVFSIYSKYYSANQKVIVHTPANYDKSRNSHYPVLYLLDGKSKIKHVIFTAKYHPKSANAYDSLADSLEILGSLDEAMNAADKAVSLLSGENDPNYSIIRKHHEKLKRMIIIK